MRWARLGTVRVKERPARLMKGRNVTTDRPTITEQATALKESMALRAPADVIAVLDAEQADLEAAGIPSGAATAGMPMPDGDLLDVRDEATTLAQARKGGPAVGVFYR